jgi:ankyrin repeat protein
MASDVSQKLCSGAADGDVAVIAAALLAGADPNVVIDNWTPMHRAALRDHVDAIAALLAADANVDGADSGGNAPLMFAAVKGNTDAVDALVAAGADVNRTNHTGDTALHGTSASGYPDPARLLLEAGAWTEVRNKDGKRPIDVVRACAQSLACSLEGLDAWLRHDCAAVVRCVQVCDHSSDKTAAPVLRALLTAAAPWSRRRPAVVACCMW